MPQLYLILADSDLHPEILCISRRSISASSWYRWTFKQSKCLRIQWKSSLYSFIQSLDSLLSKSISETIGFRLAKTQNPTQIAQIITNLEHFQDACTELDRSLTNLRFVILVSVAQFGGANVFTSSTQRGGVIRLTAPDSFESTISRSRSRMSGLISSKLDQCFELSEYNWTPSTREISPSTYLYELVNWLTTVVDSLAIKETYKEEAYKGALGYIVECLMVSRW